MPRLVGNWLRAYAEYSKESESPESFHLWTALSVIASAARRNVWVDQGIFKLYPNMFVILVGPPGKVSKTTAIRLGRKLLLGLDYIYWGPDSVTMEELVRQLAKAGMKDQKQSAITIHSSELSSLIEPSGIKMIQFLTDIYDNDDTWKRATKHQGRETIKLPCVNILAGTTPSWIAEGLPSDIVGHGFTSRVIFVFEDDPRFLNPRPKEPEQELRDAMIEDLKTISELEGPFHMDEEADRLYDKYYREVFANPPEDFRIEGYYWRKAKVHLLKIAMLVALSERDELVVTGTDVKVAWNLLEQLEISMHKTFSAVGKYDHASDLERIWHQIARAGKIKQDALYNSNYAVGNVDEISRILQMLTMMGKIERIREGDTIWYVSKGAP
jgi:hypothetical protein